MIVAAAGFCSLFGKIGVLSDGGRRRSATSMRLGPTGTDFGDWDLACVRCPVFAAALFRSDGFDRSGRFEAGGIIGGATDAAAGRAVGGTVGSELVGILAGAGASSNGGPGLAIGAAGLDSESSEGTGVLKPVVCLFDFDSMITDDATSAGTSTSVGTGTSVDGAPV